MLSSGSISLKAYADVAHALVSLRPDTSGEIDKLLNEQHLSCRIVLTLPRMLVLPEILKRSDLLSAVPQSVAQLGGRPRIANFPVAFEGSHLAY